MRVFFYHLITRNYRLLAFIVGDREPSFSVSANMRLSVKILGGEECDVSVDPQDSVEFLKREIEVKLKLDKQTEQKLLFKGKALQGKTQS